MKYQTWLDDERWIDSTGQTAGFPISVVGLSWGNLTFELAVDGDSVLRSGSDDKLRVDTATGNVVLSGGARINGGATISSGGLTVSAGGAQIGGNVDVTSGTVRISGDAVWHAGNFDPASKLEADDLLPYARLDGADFTSGISTTGSMRASGEITTTSVYRVGYSEATGGGSSAVIGNTGDRVWIAPTDMAGGYSFAKELTFDPSGDAVWTARGGLKTTGDLSANGLTIGAAELEIGTDGDTVLRHDGSDKLRVDDATGNVVLSGGTRVNSGLTVTAGGLTVLGGASDFAGGVNVSVGALSVAGNTVWHAGNLDVDAKIAEIIGAAPDTLDTLNELAAALGDDPNFSATISGQIAAKLDATAYTAADVRDKLLTVDGSGSGIDADTLDGDHADVFAKWEGGEFTGEISGSSRALWRHTADQVASGATAAHEMRCYFSNARSLWYLGPRIDGQYSFSKRFGFDFTDLKWSVDDGFKVGGNVDVTGRVSTAGIDSTVSGNWAEITSSVGTGTRKMRIGVADDGDFIVETTDPTDGTFAQKLRFNLDDGTVILSGGVTVNGGLTSTGDLNLGNTKALKINDITVLTGQMPAVSDPIGGMFIDIQARAQIAALIDELQDIKLMAAT